MGAIKNSRGPARAAGIIAAGLAAASAVTACTAAATAAHGTAGGASPANALEAQYSNAVRAVLPSVVQINTTSGTGSGVVYDDKGDIVTNAHVVSGAQTMQVVPTTGGDTLTAHVVGAFTPDDLAVIRVTSGAGSLKPAKFASSAGISVGQIVLAMGNPLGLTGSVTQGIISATGRTVTESSTGGGTPTTIADALQTSAPINGGNSGGALVNLSDEVVGIPTAAARDPEAGSAPGIGFAIPSATVTSIAGQLISKGRVSQSNRAALGVTARTVASPDGQPAGVAVESLTSGGPAESAGLRAGDVITAVSGEQTPSAAALNAVLANLKPGDKADVNYLRNGASATAHVTLGSLKS